MNGIDGSLLRYHFTNSIIFFYCIYWQILRRAVLVTTPSLRNKELFSSYFPEISVFAAPNRPNNIDTRTIQVTRPQLIANDLLHATPSNSLSNQLQHVTTANLIMKDGVKHDKIHIYNLNSNQNHRQLKRIRSFNRMIFPPVSEKSLQDSNSVFNSKSVREGMRLRIVVIGALSIGKGSWIAQEVI